MQVDGTVAVVAAPGPRAGPAKPDGEAVGWNL